MSTVFPLRPICTGQSRLSWWAITWLSFPAAVATFVELCSLNAMTFTMRKFVADPAVIMLLGSINLAFNFLVAPWAAWKSDRIWTPWGRRIPLMVIGWTILAAALAATPFAPNLIVLSLIILAYQLGMDLGYTGPWDPLFYEAVPPGQRGRALAVGRIVKKCGRGFFFLVLIGQFDATCGMKLQRSMYGTAVFSLTGEQIIYFCGAGLVMLCVIGVLLGVREVAPTPVNHTTTTGAEEGVGGSQRLSAEQPVSSWWTVGVLTYCLLAAKTDLGQLQPLLITEQFGYSKLAMGQLLTWAMVPEMLLVLPLLMTLADRVPRSTLAGYGLILCTAQPMLYWLFVKYVAAQQTPTPTQFVLFLALGHLGRMTVALSVEPLLFERVSPNHLGSLNMGILLIRGTLTLVLVNGMGWWVKYLSADFEGQGFDYMSGYLYTALICAVGLAAWGLMGRLSLSGITQGGDAVNAGEPVARRGTKQKVRICREAFTLIEMLVILSIIGLMMAVLLPAVQSARESARRTQCVNNLKQLGLSAHSYQSASRTFPSGVNCERPGSVSLFVLLLPYLEQESLFHQWNMMNLAQNARGGSNALTAQVIPGLLCPADYVPRNPIEVKCGLAWYGLTSYAGNGGTKSYPPGSPELRTDGVFFATGRYSIPAPKQQPVCIAEVQDGLSCTLLLAERSHHDPEFDRRAAAESERMIGEYGEWSGAINSVSLGDVTLSSEAPLNYRVPASTGSSAGEYLRTRDWRVSAFGSNHPGGANFVLGDGSVRFIHDAIVLDVLRSLSTRAGSELAAPP